ncbi:MAG: caspase family protein, partial [Thermoguttaceae bacterium]|nr:caspase family protein [Thermoguttaceae bacterium]
ENGEIRYQRVIDNLVITGETNETGAYLSDWFRFNLKQSENDSVPNYKDAFIQIDMSDTLEGLDVKGNLGDLDLYLYRAVLTDDTLSFEEAYEQGAYTLELVQSSKGVGLQERISFSNLDIADGNYFICVSGFNGSANRYSLTLGGFTKSGDVLPTDPAEYFTEDSVTVLNSVATLNWRVPVDDYVSRVKIEYRAVGTSEWVEAGSFKPSVTSCKIAGLSSDTEYEFRMTVVNFFVEDDPLTATVTKTTDAFVNETVYRAVIVGVADYPGVAADLVAPVNDAKAFRDALLQDPQWAESNITMLVNSDATRDAVLDALAHVAEDSDDNDVFVFYFAGSGSSAVIGSQEVGYLKTCGSVRNEFISSSDLLKAVESIAAGSKQFVLDAGQISADAESTGINYAPFIESLTTSKINGGSERVAQTTVLTSGDDENLISPSGLGNRSVFNRALVDAMEKYLQPVTIEDVELAEEEAKNAKPGVVVEIPEISDGRVSFEELFAAIKADESVQLYSVGASLASNSEDETVLMSGLWNEADAFNDEWLENGAIVVTTTVDCVDAHDGKISLREAAALMGVQLENTVAVEENATFTLSAGSVVTIGTSVGYVVEDVQLVYANGAFRTSEACQLQTETTLLDFSRAGQGVTWTAEDWEDGKVALVDSKDLAVNDLEFKLVGSVTIDGETAVFDLEDGDVLSTAAAEGEGREVTVKKVGQEYRLFVGEVPYTRLTGLYFNGEPIAISKGVALAQIETIKKVIFDPSLEGQTLELNATAGPIVFANGGAVIGSGAANPITLSGSNVHTLIRATGSETTTIVGLKLTNAGDSAIVVDEGASLELANCLLADSSVQDEAIIENNGYLLLVNDTIVNNKTNGFLVGGEGETTLKNTIVALNDADLSNLTYDATNVVGAADPGFVDAENGDYRLTKTSEALDIGQNSAVKLSGGVVIVSD